MRLISATIEGFRCFSSPQTIKFDNFTTFIGKNDIGKSSVCAALDAFFNQNADVGDYSVSQGTDKIFSVTCEFSNLPDEILLDAANKTNLKDENLLTVDGTLRIKKVFTGSSKKPQSQTFIVCNHPTLSEREEILSLKVTELKAYAQKVGVDLSSINQTIKADIRKAIFAAFVGVPYREVTIQVKNEDANYIAKDLESRHMPAFFLFKADRESSDQDSEAQNPLKIAVKEALKTQQEELNRIAEQVKKKLREIVDQTVNKLEEMDPTLRDTLKPNISDPQWASVFKISLDDKDDIPVNKRGSGIRRLLLLNFFRAQVERDTREDQNIILAVEEPETALHPDKQKMLVKALLELSDTRYQVVLTTHAPGLAQLLPTDSIRYVCEDPALPNRRSIQQGETCMRAVVSALGLLRGHNVKLFVGVEGPNDENFIKTLTKTLHAEDPSIPDFEQLEADGEIVFILLGGSTILQWASTLMELKIPELYLCDRDFEPPLPPHYHEFAQEIDNRDGADCFTTDKCMIENYLHYEAINEAAIATTRPLSLANQPGDFDNVPELVARGIHNNSASPKVWEELDDECRKKKINKVKKFLNTNAVECMTKKRLNAVDTNGFLMGFISAARRYLEQ